MKRPALLFKALGAGLCAVGLAQAQTGTLAFDTSNMKVSVSLDRTVYLPGEIAQVTLEVSNPSSSAVTSLTPFVSATGCLFFQWDEGGRMVGPPSAHCASPAVDATNTTAFAPGETKRLVLNSYDKVFGTGQPVMEGYGALTKPGEYGVTYWYGTTRATARYTVAPAQLEAEAVVPLRQVTISHDPTEPKPYAVTPYIHVVALRSEGVSYICVPQRGVRERSPVASRGVLATKPSFDHLHLMVAEATPFKRIAEVRDPVAQLSATADVDGNLTIEWTDINGGRGRSYYAGSYALQKH